MTTTAEIFRNAMTLQWEQGIIRQFDNATLSIHLFDEFVKRVEEIKAWEQERDVGYDKDAVLWFFGDGSWAIVAEDGNAIYNIGFEESSNVKTKLSELEEIREKIEKLKLAINEIAKSVEG